jgi:hypothetical protein
MNITSRVRERHIINENRHQRKAAALIRINGPGPPVMLRHEQGGTWRGPSFPYCFGVVVGVMGDGAPIGRVGWLVLPVTGRGG